MKSQASYEYFARSDPAYDPIDRNLCKNFMLSSQNRVAELKRLRLLTEERKAALNDSTLTQAVLSKTQAKKRSAKFVKHALAKHRKID